MDVLSISPAVIAWIFYPGLSPLPVSSDNSFNVTLQEQFLRFLQDSSLAQPGQRIAVACSGGPDSTALLLLFHQSADQIGCVLSVAHLNHLLRGDESVEDETFIRALAEKLDIQFFCEQTDVRKIAQETGSNLEEAARTARLHFFSRLIQSGHADRIALGHTADDQVETVLFRFLRGSGLRGLAGIYPAVGEKIIRPLLPFRRNALQSWLRENGYRWREDSSNFDLQFTRNRIRHVILPSLMQLNPRLVETLSDTAELARDEEFFWQDYIASLAPGIMRTEPHALRIDIRLLRCLPLAVARRVLRHVISIAQQRFGGATGALPEPFYPHPGTEFRHIQQILRLAFHGQSGSSLLLPGHLETYREFQHLIFREPMQAATDERFNFTVHIPGTIDVPSISRAYDFQFVAPGEAEARYNLNGCHFLDAGLAHLPLTLRNWEPGDAYQPNGRQKRHKLKELFQKDRIPLHERVGWPVLVAGEKIVWASRWGVAEDHAPRTGDQQAVLLCERHS